MFGLYRNVDFCISHTYVLKVKNNVAVVIEDTIEDAVKTLNQNNIQCDVYDIEVLYFIEATTKRKGIVAYN